MGAWLLSLATAEFWSRAGYALLLTGLAGEFAVIFISLRRHKLEKGLAAIFTAMVAVGVYVGHVGDDALFEAVKIRAENAERRLADRKLSDRQLTVIAGKLKEYSGYEYEITAVWNNKESVALFNRVISALDLAQWKQIKPDSPGILLPGLVAMQVWVRPPISEKTKGAALALVSALKGEALEAELKEYEPQVSEINARIEIWVGTAF